MLNSGKLIENIRTRYNISQNELRCGVCSKGQLTKIETGENSAEKLQYECLYQRLGKFIGRFEALLDLDEYELLKKRWNMCSLIDEEKYERAKNAIDEYRIDIKKYEKKININLHLQYTCLVECEIMHRMNMDITGCMNKLMEGIKYTYEDFDINNIGQYYLSRIELYLITQYARYMDILGDKESAVALYQAILKKVDEDRYDRSEREIHYRHIGYWLMLCYLENEDYMNAIEIGQKTYEHTVNGAYISFLAELKEGIIICKEALGEDMTKDRSYLKILKRMNERFGVRKAEDFFPRYVEEKAYNVNDIISQRRKMQGLTQEQLSADTCSTMTIHRMEKNIYTLQKAKREGLLYRVNLSGDKYVALVDTYDYAVFETLNSIRDMIDRGEYIKAEEQLYILESQNKFESTNSKQYIFCQHEEIHMMNNQQYGATVEQMKEMLAMTLGDIDKSNTQGVILFENEWSILDNIIVYYEREKEYSVCMKYLDNIVKKYDDSMVNNNPYMYMHVKRRIGDVLGEMGKIDAANAEIMKGLYVCCNYEFLPYLRIYPYVYAWNILERKHNISNSERQICKEMLEYAYVVSCIYNNTFIKELIEKESKKYGIVMDIN